MNNFAIAHLEDQDNHMQTNLNEVKAIEKAASMVAPLWGLSDMVAVNPYLGLSEKSIESAHQYLQKTTGAFSIPGISVQKELFRTGAYTIDDLTDCIKRTNSDIQISELISDLQNQQQLLEQSARITSYGNFLDQNNKYDSNWVNGITIDIGRFCSIRFDEGVSQFYSYKQHSLFFAWKQYAQTSLAMHARGLKNFHKFIQKLSDNAYDALEEILNDFIRLKPQDYEQYFLASISEVQGWAGYLRSRNWGVSDKELNDVKQLLIIRLVYDYALLKQFPQHTKSFHETFIKNDLENYAKQSHELKKLSILQDALELNYQNKLFKTLQDENNAVTNSNSLDRPSAQVVLCIDVRSETLRRKLLEVCPTIQVFGFAGFFGLPIKLENQHQNRSQCPVLISPSFSVVNETPCGSKFAKLAKDSLDKFSQIGFGSFTFVELFGLASIGSILKDFFKAKSTKQIEIQPRKYTLVAELDTKVKIAEGIIKNLSLPDCLAKLILLCGHQSTVTNNPTEAALQCGACGGHSGAPNALVAADLLNDILVRIELKHLGYNIPDDTYFIAGVHDTVTDTVQILSNDIPSTHTDDLKLLVQNIQTATNLTAFERNHNFSSETQIKLGSKNLNKKMWDYSEVRPEWALAGNASFIVAPASELKNMNLQGRSFLHNYDQNNDHDGSVLETILTAPMVVASWINLQYYASSIDPKNYGSGLKTIHNICGNIGVVCGNDGDLAVGLSAQSVHDGANLVHQPIRLNVVIQASLERIQAILDNHPDVASLFYNGWVHLFAAPHSFETVYRMSRQGKWQLRP